MVEQNTKDKEQSSLQASLDRQVQSKEKQIKVLSQELALKNDEVKRLTKSC